MAAKNFLNRCARSLIASALGIASVAGSEAYASCTFGTSGEPTLQATFDSLLGAATVDVQAACLADGTDALWTTVNQLGGVDIKIELAGTASTNTFGVYDPVTIPAALWLLTSGLAGLGALIRRRTA